MEDAHGNRVKSVSRRNIGGSGFVPLSPTLTVSHPCAGIVHSSTVTGNYGPTKLLPVLNTPGDYTVSLSLQTNLGTSTATTSFAVTGTSTCGDLDFGDAPDPTYPSKLASDGARHTDPSALWLGATSTAESDSIQTGDAGDDGLLGSLPLKLSFSRSSTDTPGFYHVLVDRNDDGDWDDPGEQELLNRSVGWFLNQSLGGTMTWPSIDLPLNGWIRITITGQAVPSNWNGTGEFAVGESEDYFLAEPLNPNKDFGDAPDGPYPSRLTSNGIRHYSPRWIGLGSGVTVDPDSRQIDADTDDGLISFDPLTVQLFNDGLDSRDLRVNVLVDADQNGAWDSATEWLVQNATSTLPASSTSTFVATGVTVPEGSWVRITVPPAILIESPPLVDYDGHGQVNGGETEDWFNGSSGSSSSTSVTGFVTLQGVTSSSSLAAIGPIVVAESLDSPASSSVSVNSNGSFEVTGLTIGKRFQITASAPGFLMSEIAEITLSASSTSLARVELRTGLVNADNVVSIQDISAAAASFGQIVSDRTDDSGHIVDMNGDDMVNVLDISAIASNFGAVSPQVWLNP